MKRNRFLVLFVCIAVGFGIGYGITELFGSTMKAGKKEKGYIPRSEIKIEDGVMTPEVLLAMGRISSPVLSPDGSKILYSVSYTDVAANRSCANLYTCNIDGSNRTQLTQFGSSASGARWSKDGKFIYYLRDGQLWKAAVGGKKLGASRKLSDIPSGISGFSLSPDESKIFYISTIEGPVKTASDVDPALDKAQAYITEDLMYRHWDHWVTTTPRTYVASMNGKITPENSTDILGDEPYELPLEPFGGEEQLSWDPSGRYIAYSCKKKTGKQYAFSTNTGIYIYDTQTGETMDLKVDGGYDTDPVWSPDGLHLAWISMARDGYEADKQRILVADLKDNDKLEFSPIRELTETFKYDASGLLWSEDSKSLYFNSISEGTQKIYNVGLDGEVSQLTADDWKYDFFSPFAVLEDGTLLSTYYCLNAPLEMVAIKDGGFKQISTENKHILDQLDEPTSESVLVKTVDGQDMQCWVLYPPHFDEHKQYPAVEIVLGGPQGTNSQDWSYRWCYRLMAQQGYIVIMPNRRGTTAFGQPWKEQISGDYCGLNMQDYLSAGRYIKSKPYVSKLACVGASYGGFSAYMLEGLHGDLYDCFIAHAGIFDEKALWYTTEEMWFANWDNGGLTEYAYEEGKTGPARDGITFGGMQQAGAPYASTPKARRHYANDPESNVIKWHTPILCIHGMMDFRIPYEQGMAAFNAAQMMGVPSKLLIFPEENHWILQPQNSLLWHREFYDWLDRWCK